MPVYIRGYEIYRSENDDFDFSEIIPIGFTSSNTFMDTTNLLLLTEYYYKIISVDKGMFKSNPSISVSDLIHDRPQLIFPGDGDTTGYFDYFEIMTISTRSDYKLIVQENKLFGEIYQKEFFKSEINTIIKVEFSNLYLVPYKKYYWRIVTFSKGNDEPNSFSELFSFTLIP